MTGYDGFVQPLSLESLTPDLRSDHIVQIFTCFKVEDERTPWTCSLRSVKTQPLAHDLKGRNVRVDVPEGLLPKKLSVWFSINSDGVVVARIEKQSQSLVRNGYVCLGQRVGFDVYEGFPSRFAHRSVRGANEQDDQSQCAPYSLSKHLSCPPFPPCTLATRYPSPRETWLLKSNTKTGKNSVHPLDHEWITYSSAGRDAFSKLLHYFICSRMLRSSPTMTTLFGMMFL